MRILIFGDSITQGFFDSQGGWATRIARNYHQTALKNLKGDWPGVFNLGVSADMVEDVLSRLENETKSRYYKGNVEEKIIVIVAIGLNDSVLTDNKALQDEYKFQEEYEKLVDKVNFVADKCLFVGLTAVDEKLTNPFPGSSLGRQYLNNRINLFEDVIKQVCMVKDVPFVRVHDAFIAALGQGKHLLSDGLHPNDAGHELLYNMIEPHVRKLL